MISKLAKTYVVQPLEKKKKVSEKKKDFNGNLFDAFAVTTSVVNRKMIVCFQKVIFKKKKVFINKVAKSR